MAQYIDKDALVADIARLDALYHVSKNLSGDLFIQELFRSLDTIEVKEVDLENEVINFMSSDEYQLGKESGCIIVAKHFFELGLKAKKEEVK